MSIFGAIRRWEVGQKDSPFLKSVTHPAMIKIGAVIPHLNKIQKMYESRDTHPEFY